MTKTIYIKLTNACNLQCKHCYNEIMHNHSFMSTEILNKVFNYIQTFDEKLDIHLHGGEPLLYNLDILLDFINKTKYLKLNWTITTNLNYKITEKHLFLFKQMIPYGNNPLILTSWDYKIRFNKENLNLWKANIKILQKNNILVQPIICLTNVLIKEISPYILFKYFKHLNIYQFNFERITNTGRAIENKLRPNNKDLQEWLLQAYKLYEKDNTLIIPLFEGIKQSLKGIYLGCRNRSCMKDVITINPDGTLSGCPNTANINYGNLNNINIKKKEELIQKEKIRNIKCLTCKFFKYCNGDCFQLEFDNTECPGMKSIYQYILKNK